MHIRNVANNTSFGGTDACPARAAATGGGGGGSGGVAAAVGSRAVGDRCSSLLRSLVLMRVRRRLVGC